MILYTNKDIKYLASAGRDKWKKRFTIPKGTRVTISNNEYIIKTNDLPLMIRNKTSSIYLNISKDNVMDEFRSSIYHIQKNKGA